MVVSIHLGSALVDGWWVVDKDRPFSLFLRYGEALQRTILKRPSHTFMSVECSVVVTYPLLIPHLRLSGLRDEGACLDMELDQ